MPKPVTDRRTEPASRRDTEAPMKAIIVTDQAAEAAGITLAQRPEPTPAINDVVVEVHASGFVPAEWEWPRRGSIAPVTIEPRRSSATSSPEWSPPSATARPDSR